MSDCQKFIGRNRAPRVQIEYDVELYGAQKKVQLPFVMGVMSDLSGKSEVPKGSVAERAFLEIDSDNFDNRMKAMKPRAAFSVPNTVTGEGNLSVDLVFEKMSDFSPAEIARKVEPLRKLLEARTQLSNLMTYMDGKAGAEGLIERLVANPDHLRALALGAGTANETEAAFAAMKAAAPQAEAIPDDSADILAGMAATAPEDSPEPDAHADILADLAASAPQEDTAPSMDDPLAGVADSAIEAVQTPDDTSAVLASLAEALPVDSAEDDGLDDLLADMAQDADEPEIESDNSLDILAQVSEQADAAEPEADGLEDMLADVAEEGADIAPEDDGLDDLLADMAVELPEDDEAEDSLEALLADVSEAGPEGAPDNGLDDLLADISSVSLPSDEDSDGIDDIDDVLADVAAVAPLAEVEDELDALLAEVADGHEEAPDEARQDDLLASLLGEIEEDDELDALAASEGDAVSLDDLADMLADVPEEAAAPVPPAKPKFEPDFGSLNAPKELHEPGARRKFRLAVLGDFSGRGNRGALETGAALGKRKGFKLDFDTMEEVIARFRTTLTLPLGDDGSAVEVVLNELDDLHPDELFENVALFNELHSLRRDLNSGRNFEQNIERMQAWGGAFGDFKPLSKKRSKGADAPADLRLSEFQNLIGDSTPKPEASAASDLISRIIGPHIVAAADNGAAEMIAAVDKALSSAMSSVLHHPDFQTIETAWRSLELLGRRVETSADLEVVVYDVSVEEFTADLAAQEDLSESGLFDMLAEKPLQDESAGPISAVVGLYTWEETPTHAELLARMARISAHIDAPFLSAISTGFMGVKPEDRHPLVKKTWGALEEMPEAKYLGLASPRFMLRMPYGKKTEPLERFDYEEFNVKEGMRSMLMANPALLVAVLLAETNARQGGDMSLGSIMSLNDMPFHYMTDQYGDQVALPCTERLLSVSGAADVIARGYMPVLSVQGQNVVKLGSFQAVGGGEVLGVWAGDAAKDMNSGKLESKATIGFNAGAEPPEAATAGHDDSGLEDGTDLDMDLDLDLGDDGLDDLLSGFDDSDGDDDDDMDADLAALLGDL